VNAGSDYQRRVLKTLSKEEYANEIKKLAYHYNKGKEDERNRILKLINEKIQAIQKKIDKREQEIREPFFNRAFASMSYQRIKIWEEQKEELEKLKEELKK
jgi:hypothetical protein